jgi:methylase of polypeptide subunit release factors
MGDKCAFVVHLSQKIKDFVMEQLKLGLIMFQIKAKHRQHVKNIMLRTCELNRYMFLIE